MSKSLEDELGFIRESFPWHFTLSKEMRVFHASSRFLQHFPKCRDGEELEKIASLVRPKISFDFDAWCKRTQTSFTIQPIGADVSLRCQLFSIPARQEILVCCRPWVTSIAQLRDHGILMEDLGVHDNTWEFLMLLEERDKVSAEILKHKNSLETIVQKRTEELESLLGVASLLAENLDSEYFYQSLAENIAKVVGVGDCCIFTPTPKGFALRGCLGGLADQPPPKWLAIDEGLPGRAAKEKKVQTELPNKICAPVFMREELQGAIVVRPKQGEELDEGHVSSLIKLALVAAPAFEASRYREELEGYLSDAVTDRHQLLLAAENTTPLLFSPGDQLGDVQLVKPIGRGILGNVWEGNQGELNRKVAVRILGKLQSVDRETRERFKQEVTLASKIDDYNILDIYSFGEDQGALYAVMEHVDGWRNLEDYLGLWDPVPVWQKVFFEAPVQMFLKILGAVDYAHRLGVVHGSIYPENILIDSKLDPKIFGYGTSNLIISKSLSDPKVFKYLSRYIPLVGRRDPAVEMKISDDILSLCSILVRCFSGPSPGDPIRPEIPEGLAPIIERAASKRSSAQYTSLEELRNDLNQWIEGRKEKKTSGFLRELFARRRGQ